MQNRLIVFTKPWKTESLERVAETVANLGFNGIELPVREGYQVEPGSVGKGLGRAVKAFEALSLSVTSVAGPLDETTIQALGDWGVGILRIMAPIDMKAGYLESERRLRERLEGLLPLLDRCKVTVGVQNHRGNMIGSAMGLLHLLERFDPRHVAAVLDPAHCTVVGEPIEIAWDIIHPRLCLLNMKSAQRRHNPWPENNWAEWDILWTTARYSDFPWATMAGLIKKDNYAGPVCLTAEYSARAGGPVAGDAVIPLLQKDLAFFHDCMQAVDGQAAS